MFLSEWRGFPSASWFAIKKNLVTARVSMLLKSRASLTCLRACFLLGLAKDLSAPRFTGFTVACSQNIHGSLWRICRIIIIIIIPNRHYLHNTVTDKLQKYLGIKRDKILWQINAVCRLPLVLSKKDNIANKLHDSLTLHISALLCMF